MQKKRPIFKPKKDKKWQNLIVMCIFLNNARVPILSLDGPAIRNANLGDSRESIRRKTPIFIELKRFARIAFKLRFAIFIHVRFAFATPTLRWICNAFGSEERWPRTHCFSLGPNDNTTPSTPKPTPQPQDPYHSLTLLLPSFHKPEPPPLLHSKDQPHNLPTLAPLRPIPLFVTC